jgi:uncharacterized protein (UPF0332 family)
MKVDLKKLVRKARRSLESAEILFHEEDDAGAVSRAYYAMFYCAEAVLQTLNLKFSSHQTVISMFGSHFAKTKIFNPELGRHLKRSYELRLKGDYQYDVMITKAEAEEAIAWANQFVETTTAYLHKNGFLQ